MWRRLYERVRRRRSQPADHWVHDDGWEIRREPAAHPDELSRWVLVTPLTDDQVRALIDGGGGAGGAAAGPDADPDDGGVPTGGQVRVRLMAEDRRSLEWAIRQLQGALLDAVEFTGRAVPCRRGPGVRAYGTMPVPPPLDDAP